MVTEASPEPLSAGYEALLLDLDGTLYRGDQPIPEAVHVLQALRGLGAEAPRLAFVTNNASRDPGQVVRHLGGLGITADAEEVFTSAQAGARLVAERLRPGAAVLVVGGDGLFQAVAAAGLRPVSQAAEDPQAVVQGWWSGVDWPQLAEGAYALARGIPWVVTNIDRTLPTAVGVAPGNGSFVDLLASVTGRRPDVIAGKPAPGLLRLAAAGQRALVVGDRLDTDIAGAVAAGLDSLLVLTGVTTVTGLLAAAKGERPTYVVGGMTALLQPAPTVSEAAGRWTCGRAAVTAEGGHLVRLHGEDPIELLRACCLAAWTLADAGTPVDLQPELAAAIGG